MARTDVAWFRRAQKRRSLAKAIAAHRRTDALVLDALADISEICEIRRVGSVYFVVIERHDVELSFVLAERLVDLMYEHGFDYHSVPANRVGMIPEGQRIR